MSNILVLADQYTAEVFQLTDFDVEICERKNVFEILSEKVKHDYSIIYISDYLVGESEYELSEIRQSIKAIIVVIPGVGSKQINFNKVGKQISREF